MTSPDNATQTTFVHSPKTDLEKAAQQESDIDGETEHDPEEARESIFSDKPEDGTKLEDTGPPDGGATAWLVVVGAWCCSFSSPGWINSRCSPSSRNLSSFSIHHIFQLENRLKLMLFH